MTWEEFSKDPETYLKIVGLLGVVATIFFGFKSQTKATKTQWKQEFYKQKMAIYLRASETVSKIAYLKRDDPSNPELPKYLFEFKTLFGGQMAIVEKSEVEEGMVLFDKALQKEIVPDKLVQLALLLSHAFRNEAGATAIDLKDESHYGPNEQILARMRNIVEG